MDTDPTPNTAIEYVYRDASNYKWFETVVVRGSLKYEDLQPYLINGEFFVPGNVGLKSLTPEVRNEDDHDWHAIFALTPTDQPSTAGSAEDLVKRFQIQHRTSWSHA